MVEELKRLVIIGSTGTGKSATCNSLCGSKDKYPTSGSTDAGTLTSTIHCVKWFGHEDK
jgi:predicted GTPase